MQRPARYHDHEVGTETFDLNVLCMGCKAQNSVSCLMTWGFRDSWIQHCETSLSGIPHVANSPRHHRLLGCCSWPLPRDNVCLRIRAPRCCAGNSSNLSLFLLGVAVVQATAAHSSHLSPSLPLSLPERGGVSRPPVLSGLVGRRETRYQKSEVGGRGTLQSSLN